MKRLIVQLIFGCNFLIFVSCQFLYPVDANPPANPLSFTCHECNEENEMACGNEQTGSSPTRDCSGIRIGCWVTLNMDRNVYQRGCIQPSSLRQGVFCNRHMEGKEFCYYEAGANGLERICAKCCLNDYCNDGLLEGSPDSRLQTCIACDGRDEQDCNVGGRWDLPDHLSEQCLMPNSDCWTGKTFYNEKVFYTRGCQISVCDQDNVAEVCTKTQNRTTCLKCCSGDSKCNYGLLSGSGYRVNAFYSLTLCSSLAALLGVGLRTFQ